LKVVANCCHSSSMDKVFFLWNKYTDLIHSYVLDVVKVLLVSSVSLIETFSLTVYMMVNKNRAVKWGRKGIACDNCDLWYHQTCMSMNSDTYLRLANTSIAWLCKVCNTPNHSSVLYTSIMSDDNQFSSLSGNETNSVNIDNLSSLNNKHIHHQQSTCIIISKTT
jgi:hypothetical protein